MRTISKGSEPPSLTTHRQSPHSGYDNYAEKDDLRHALITEQHWLCCYCMSRIREGRKTMTIEHWKSRTHYRGEELNYRNLLGACLGGRGQPPRHQHCDTRKGSRELMWNPADSAHRIETRVWYALDGSIHANDESFDNQLETVLNLNLEFLKNNRKGVLDALLKWWRRHRPVSRRRIEQKIEEYAQIEGQLTPHCQVAIWWLKQKLVQQAQRAARTIKGR